MPKITNAKAVLGFISGKFGRTDFRTATSRNQPIRTASDTTIVAIAAISVTSCLGFDTVGVFILDARTNGGGFGRLDKPHAKACGCDYTTSGPSVVNIFYNKIYRDFLRGAPG